jgi:hypothetical protein
VCLIKVVELGFCKVAERTGNKRLKEKEREESACKLKGMV